MANANKNNAAGATLTAPLGGHGSVNLAPGNTDGFVLRMRELVAHFDSMAETARKGGFPESTVKKWVDGISDPSRAKCIQLAHGTGVSLLWLVAGVGEMFDSKSSAEGSVMPSQSVSQENLTLALQLVEEVVTDRDLPMPPARKAELTFAVAELLEEGMPEAKVLRFVRATTPA